MTHFVHNYHHLLHTITSSKKQSEAYQQNLKEAKETDSVGVLQIDFSEHFSIFWQNEAQTTHWNKKQITIFSCFWHKDLCESAVVISDDLHHCKDSIILFIDNILQNIVKPQDCNINKLHLWWNGQFKNKFIAAGLLWLERRFNVSKVWNLFATSQGKGPVDAIGGTVKQLVSNNIIWRVDHVNDAEFFLDSLAKCNTKIKSYYISSNNIDSIITDKDLQ